MRRPTPINVYGRSKLRGEEAIAAIGGASLTLRARAGSTACAARISC